MRASRVGRPTRSAPRGRRSTFRSVAYCQAGQIMSAVAVLRTVATPTVHPLVTLFEKLDAMARRYGRDEMEADAFVRHYEDAAQIITSQNVLIESSARDGWVTSAKQTRVSRACKEEWERGLAPSSNCDATAMICGTTPSDPSARVLRVLPQKETAIPPIREFGVLTSEGPRKKHRCSSTTAESWASLSAGRYA